jgi:hypothetical protein
MVDIALSLLDNSGDVSGKSNSCRKSKSRMRGENKGGVHVLDPTSLKIIVSLRCKIHRLCTRVPNAHIILKLK